MTPDIFAPVFLGGWVISREFRLHVVNRRWRRSFPCRRYVKLS